MIPTSSSRAAHGPSTSDLRMTAHIMLMEVEVVINSICTTGASCSFIFYSNLISITFLTSSSTTVLLCSTGLNLHKLNSIFVFFVCTKHFSDSLGHQENIISVLGRGSG